MRFLNFFVGGALVLMTSTPTLSQDDFEYKEIKSATPPSEFELNELAQEGWELIDVLSYQLKSSGNRAFSAYFKRQINLKKEKKIGDAPHWSQKYLETGQQ